MNAAWPNRRHPQPALSPAGWLGIALALLPLPVKRAVLLGEPSVLHWLSWDYGARAVMLAGVAVVYAAGAIGPPPARAFWQKSALVLLIAVVGELFLISVRLISGDVFPAYFKLFTEPAIADPALQLADLSLGLLLVAVSEELVFRRLLFSLLERWAFGKIPVLCLSAALFASIHVTSGLHTLVFTFVDGLVLGLVFQSTGRISMCIALHYVIDFYIFGLSAFERGAFGPATSS